MYNKPNVPNVHVQTLSPFHSLFAHVVSVCCPCSMLLALHIAPRTQVEQKLAEAMVDGPTLPPKSSAAQSEDLPSTEELDSDGEEEGEGPWTRVEEGSMDMASSSGSSAAEKQVGMAGRVAGQG